MAQVFRDSPGSEDNTESIVLSKLILEVYRKMDWFCGMAVKITADPRLKTELETRDDKIFAIGNLVELVARENVSMENVTDLITSPSMFRDFFWQCWKSAQADASERPVKKESFDKWFDTTFPSPKQFINERIRVHAGDTTAAQTIPQ
jgi:hypothetical protein